MWADIPPRPRDKTPDRRIKHVSCAKRPDDYPTPTILAALHSYLKATDVHATTEQEGFSDEQVHEEPGEQNALLDNLSILHVSVIPSPFLNMYIGHNHVRLTLDTGATTNMIQADFAKKIGLPLTPASQLVHQADSITPLDVYGEAHCQLKRGNGLI